MNDRKNPNSKTHDSLAVFQGVLKDLRNKNLAVRMPITIRNDGGKVQLQAPVLCWWYSDKVSGKLREAGHKASKSLLDMRILANMLDVWSRNPDARDEQVHQHWNRNPDRVNLKHADGMVRITVKVPNPNGTEILDHTDFSVAELRKIKETFEKAGLLYQMLRALRSDQSRGFLSLMDQFYRSMMDEKDGKSFEEFIVKAMEEYYVAKEHGKDPMKLFPEEPKKVKPTKPDAEPPQLARGTGETPATAPEGNPPAENVTVVQPTAIQQRLRAQASGGNGAPKATPAPEAPKEAVSLPQGVKLKSLADLASLVKPPGE